MEAVSSLSALGVGWSCFPRPCATNVVSGADSCCEAFPIPWTLPIGGSGKERWQHLSGFAETAWSRTRGASHVAKASSRKGSNTEKRAGSSPSSRQPGDASASSGDEAFDDRIPALKSSGSPQTAPDMSAEGAQEQTALAEEASNPWVKIIAGAAAIALLGSIVVGNLVPQNAGLDGGPSSSAAQQVQVDSEEAQQLRRQGLAFEEILQRSSADVEALEGAGVIYATLGEYVKAADYLEKLVKARPQYVEALRLLAEVKFESKDYSRAAYMYRRAIKASPEESLSLVKALADTLISNNAPNEAVDEILKARDRVRKLNASNVGADSVEDEVPVDLLLAQAYQYWDKPDKALTVYDELAAGHPDDFRPYLAKGILLKQQKREAEAEQALEQARLLVPEAAQQLVPGPTAEAD